MAPVHPFTFAIPPPALADLRSRLAATRWPPTVTGGGRDAWDDGAPLAYVQSLATEWGRAFDFKAFEARVNAFPNYTTRITLPDAGACDVHFIHAPSARGDAVPLLLLHGWPGSIVEFLHVIKPLTSPPAAADPAFHVVVPSLPGYGMSGAPEGAGWGVRAMADAMHVLMHDRLGYARYAVQGGDWGAIICAALARRHGAVDAGGAASAPPSGLVTRALRAAGVPGPAYPGPPSPTAPGVTAAHVNLAVAAPALASPFTLLQAAAAAAAPHLPAWCVSLVLTAAELDGVQAGAAYQAVESGYFKIQGTRPRTLGFALADSPAGTLAWVVEKFHAWSDQRAAGPDAPPGAAVDAVFGRRALLSNATLYWLGARAASSVRLYKEFVFQDEMRDVLKTYCSVPLGVLVAPRELFRPPRAWVAASANVARWTEIDRGGHFLALEEADAWVADMRAFFGGVGRG